MKLIPNFTQTLKLHSYSLSMPGNHGRKNLVQPEYLCSLTKEGFARENNANFFGLSLPSLLLGHMINRQLAIWVYHSEMAKLHSALPCAIT